MKTLLFLQSVHGVTLYTPPAEVTEPVDKRNAGYLNDEATPKSTQDIWYASPQSLSAERKTEEMQRAA